jgi:hypothetical protein
MCLSLPPASAGFLPGLPFNPENGGNVSPKGWVLSELHDVTTQQRRVHSSFLYIYCLFNDALSISDYIALNGKMIS